MSDHSIPTDDDLQTGRLSIPDQQADLPVGAGHSSGSGGGGGVKVWVVSGRLRVRESEITGSPVERDLKGIEVKVSASDLGADGPWSDWGTVRTGSSGAFELRESNNGKTRFFRVQARLVASDLEVNDAKVDDLLALDLLDTNWRTVWKSNDQRSGPAVPAGTLVFAAGGREDLGNETFRRQALIWFVLRTAVDRLVQEDPWFAMKRKFAAIYPAHVITGTSYTNGITRMVYLHQGKPDDDWHPDVVLHEFMHMWNYDHNHGTINWLGAVCSLRGEHPIDLDTHATQENPNVAFAEGCSEWASNALLHALWGTRQRRPLNRRHVAASLGFTTLEMVEKSDRTTESALRLLCVDDNRGWWSHLFGTAETSPENRPTDSRDGSIAFPEEVGIANLANRQVPADRNRLSVWEVLRAFRASPADGWPTDLEVGNVDHGILRFIDRVVDIHHLGEPVRLMLKRCIDPLATDEPRDALERDPRR